MRILGLLLLVIIPGTGGCSILVLKTGCDLNELQSRTEARKQFGTPVKSGQMLEDVPETDTYPPREHDTLAGLPYDEFVTHTKIGYATAGYGMGIAMTYGLIEFVAFPYSLYDMSANILFGHRVRYVYNQDGTVKDIFVNGQSYLGPNANGPK